MKSKFKIRDNRTIAEKAQDWGKSMLFWRGRKKGIIFTRNIEWNDIREIFFPRNENEKYSYLGNFYVSQYNQKGEESIYYEPIMSLVRAMDKEAKPKWCPRWFLRFLNVFGDDKSIVRVRNRKLANLRDKITRGIRFNDWKTKWEWYDLRISIYASQELNDMADLIERDFYFRGKEEDEQKYPALFE